MKTKKVKTQNQMTPEQAVAELKKKYPNDVKIIDEKVVEPQLNKEQAQEVLKAIKKDEAAKPAKEKKPSVLLERIAFLTPLIESGQHTQAELLDKVMEKFPTLTKSTVQTFLTDSKNPKYNKFHKLVVLNDDGKLIFAK